MLVFLQTRNFIYHCTRFSALVIVSFTSATATVMVMFYAVLMGQPTVLTSILSDVQIISYQRHGQSILISFIILDASSIIVAILLVLGIYMHIEPKLIRYRLSATIKLHATAE